MAGEDRKRDQAWQSALVQRPVTLRRDLGKGVTGYAVSRPAVKKKAMGLYRAVGGRKDKDGGVQPVRFPKKSIYESSVSEGTKN